MLHHQNEVLISHAKLMNENQQVLKNLLQKSQGGKNGGAAVEIGKAMVQELMKPLVGQVDDIKQIYEDTRKCANEVNETLNGIKKSKKLDLDGQPEREKDFVDKFGNYMVAASDQSTQQKLREKFGEADSLTKLYKEKFRDLESFESEQYLKNLSKLNKELRELEQRSAKGQQELESRIEDVNKKYNLVLPASYLDAMQKNMKNINFLQAKKELDDKLGGEFDNSEFQTDVERILFDFKTDREKYLIDIKSLDLVVPERPGPADKEYFEKVQAAPGILDTLKQRIAAMKQAAEAAVEAPVQARRPQAAQPADRPSQQPQSAGPKKPQTDAPISIHSILDKPKKSRAGTKPEHLRNIITKPLPCAIDLQFKKLQPDPADYNTLFDDPDPIDLALIEKRVNEPYDVQLRKEDLASRPDNDRRPTRESAAPGDPYKRYREDARLPEKTDKPETRKPADPRPAPRTPEESRDDLPKKEAPTEPAPDSKKPAVRPRAESGERLHIGETDSRGQRQLFTIDERGNNLIDEDLLLEGIRSNMGSIKDFLRSNPGYRPFEGYKDTQDIIPEDLDQRQRAQVGPPRDPIAGSRGLDEDGQRRIVDDISNNLAKMINDVLHNVQQRMPAQEADRTYSQADKPVADSVPVQPKPVDRQQSGDGRLDKPKRFDVNEYYRSLENNRANRPPSTTLDRAPQRTAVLDDQRLDSYLRHLSDAKARDPIDRQHSSMSEGEIGHYIDKYESRRDHSDSADQAQAERIDKQQSEGEVSIN